MELLLREGACKEHRNVSDYTPLSLAASGGYVEIVNMLLNAGAEINSRTGSKVGVSALRHLAAGDLTSDVGGDERAQGGDAGSPRTRQRYQRADRDEQEYGPHFGLLSRKNRSGPSPPQLQR